MDLNETALRLSRNPLGIIALFIVLVYAMASLVLVQGNFQGPERMPLVWFLVVFPPIVLVAFVFLVAKHHTKLYAPGDFRNEENFVSALGPGARRRRLALEGEEPVSDSEEEVRAGPAPGNHRVERAETSPAAPLGGATRYFIAEELVLRKLETEWQVAIQREVRVGDVAVDGIAFQKDGSVVIVEAKAPRDERLAGRAVLRAAEHAESALAALRRRRRPARFLIAVVLPKPENTEVLTVQMNQLLREKGVSPEVECRVFSMNVLADDFGLSEPMALIA